MHENVGLISDLANAIGATDLDTKILLNQAGVPWQHLEGADRFSRRHLVAAFQSGLVKVEKPEGVATATYTIEEASERYRASLPDDGSVPF